MTSGSNIRAIGPDSAPEAQVDTDEALLLDAELAEEEWAEDWEDEPAAPRDFGWVVPSIAALAIAAWTGFYGWAHQSEILSGGTAQQWTGWITTWSVPVLLVVGLWLLALRNSTREANRFGDVARSLSDESRTLETRLSTVNRELSLAREFLGSQSRELDSLGRVATERLSEHADNLQNLVTDNGAQIDAIASVSTTALENMVRLRDDLPVIANSARDVTNNIGSAGRAAHGQVEELVTGFERLNQFGQASERQVEALQIKIDAALAGFEAQTAQVDSMTSTRFEALRNKSEEVRADLDQREVEALTALRRRADTLAEELSGSRTELAEQEEQALISVRERLTSLKTEVSTIGRSVREGEQGALAAWGEQVSAMQDRLQEAITRVGEIDEAAAVASRQKIDELSEEAERVDHLVAERSRQISENFALRQEELTNSERTAVEALTARLAELDAEIAERRDEQVAQTRTLAEHGETIAQRLGALRDDMSLISAQGGEAEQILGQGAAELAGHLETNRTTLDATAESVRTLTIETVRLLELIQASAQHSREELPSAITMAEAQLSTTEERVKGLHFLLDEAAQKGEELAGYVLQVKEEGREGADQVETAHAKLTTVHAHHRSEIENIRTSLTDLTQQSETLSERAREELRASIGQLEQAAREAVGSIEAGSASNIKALAQSIGEEASTAIDRALRERTGEALAELETSAASAASASREAAIQLRDQLGKVNELAGNLEARVARARERAEEQVDNDFSRRVALITESLNSNAIDLSKALSNDVTDTAWASYLRGDRGIFTRRAVRLLDNSEAREIAEIYDADAEFADNVSRYIHDFEAMLRAMLSTRDGNALGVTLLSSDMGKLYVALAQSIERLRT